jgi:hypothetical protein
MPEETEKPPTPTNEVKKEAKVVSVRPKPDFADFLNNLIIEKGTGQLALEHCIHAAMNQANTKPVPAPAPAPLPPAPGYVPEKSLLEKLKALGYKKKLLLNETITYCINYTLKNDWL